MTAPRRFYDAAQEARSAHHRRNLRAAQLRRRPFLPPDMSDRIKSLGVRGADRGPAPPVANPASPSGCNAWRGSGNSPRRGPRRAQSLPSRASVPGRPRRRGGFRLHKAPADQVARTVPGENFDLARWLLECCRRARAGHVEALRRRDQVRHSPSATCISKARNRIARRASGASLGDRAALPAATSTGLTFP